MATLKLLSFPSPGIVTSSSTWDKITKEITHAHLVYSEVLNDSYKHYFMSSHTNIFQSKITPPMKKSNYSLKSQLSQIIQIRMSVPVQFPLTLSLPMGKGIAVYKFFLPSYTGFRSPKICVLKCWTMCSTISLENKRCVQIQNSLVFSNSEV